MTFSVMSDRIGNNETGRLVTVPHLTKPTTAMLGYFYYIVSISALSILAEHSFTIIGASTFFMTYPKNDHTGLLDNIFHLTPLDEIQAKISDIDIPRETVVAVANEVCQELEADLTEIENEIRELQRSQAETRGRLALIRFITKVI